MKGKIKKKKILKLIKEYRKKAGKQMTNEIIPYCDRLEEEKGKEVSEPTFNFYLGQSVGTQLTLNNLEKEIKGMK